MTKEQNEFIKNCAMVLNSYIKDYGIEIVSPIIAQAIIESNWGKSTLSSKYHNYHGLKCGSKWKGKSVNLKTKEEYSPGTLTQISANFRVFDSFEAGMRGYLDFISTSRYSNLRGETDAKTYLQKIRADGFATSSSYVNTCYATVEKYGLKAYDNIVTAIPTTLESVALEVIAGKFGNGAIRKQKLTEAGYDYRAVQNKVNELLSAIH